MLANRLVAVAVGLVVLLGAAGATNLLEQDQLTADKLMAASRFDEAARIYERVLSRLEGEQAYLTGYRIGYTLHRRGRYDEAIERYKKTMAIPGVPGSFRAKLQLQIGRCLQLSGGLEEALSAYVAVEAIKGVEPAARAGARLAAGYTHNKIGRKGKAYQSFIGVTEVTGAPKWFHQAAFVATGDLLQAQRRYEEALSFHEKAVALGASSGWGRRALNRATECRAVIDADAPFFIAPYVSLVSATEATIFWISLEGVEAGSVVVRNGDEEFCADATVKRMVDREANRQAVRLEGLRPYTLYEYEVTSGGKVARGSFRTARDKPGPVRFVAYGDTQTGWQIHSQLALAIAAERPDFVLHVGDCVEKGSRWDEWKVQFFDPGKPFMQKSPIWVARGNHDDGRYFPVLFGREGAMWQSFTFGDVHVMVLESTWGLGGQRGEKQLAWLERQIKSSDAKWKIIALHHPMFHTANGDRLMGQKKFRPLVERLDADLVINGHYHVYTRLLPIGESGRKPVINITTGGGGGMVNPNTTVTPIAEKEAGVHHYCTFQIEGDRLDMIVRDIDGGVIDRMTLIKRSDTFQPEVLAKAVDSATAKAIHMVYNDLQHPASHRHHLTGQLIDAGGKMRVVLDRNILDISKLPAQTRLIVGADTKTKWIVETQSLDLSSGELAFNVSWSGDAESKPGPLWIVLTLKVAQRVFEPRAFNVTFNSD